MFGWICCVCVMTVGGGGVIGDSHGSTVFVVHGGGGVGLEEYTAGAGQGNCCWEAVG